MLIIAGDGNVHFWKNTVRSLYYDPKIGRYLRVDPIGFDGGDVNLYAYVLSNPINTIDMLGLFEWPWERKRREEEEKRQRREADEQRALEIVNDPVVRKHIRRTRRLAEADYDKSIPNEYPVQFYQCDAGDVLAQDIPVECFFPERGGIQCNIKEIPPDFIEHDGEQCPKLANSHVHPNESLVFPSKGIPYIDEADDTSVLGRPMIIIGTPGQVGVLMPRPDSNVIRCNSEDGGFTYDLK